MLLLNPELSASLILRFGEWGNPMNVIGVIAGTGGYGDSLQGLISQRTKEER